MKGLGWWLLKPGNLERLGTEDSFGTCFISFDDLFVQHGMLLYTIPQVNIDPCNEGDNSSVSFFMVILRSMLVGSI